MGSHHYEIFDGVTGIRGCAKSKPESPSPQIRDLSSLNPHHPPAPGSALATLAARPPRIESFQSTRLNPLAPAPRCLLNRFKRAKLAPAIVPRHSGIVPRYGLDAHRACWQYVVMSNTFNVTFRYDKLTATSYRVSDAHTGEAYGVVRPAGLIAAPGWCYSTGAFPWMGNYATRDDAARALHAARHAHGFEAGAL